MPKKKIEETVNNWGKLCQSLIIIPSVCTTVFIFFNSIIYLKQFIANNKLKKQETEINH